MATTDDRQLFEEYTRQLRRDERVAELLDALADELVAGKPVVVSNVGKKSEARVAWSDSDYSATQKADQRRIASEPFTAREAIQVLRDILTRGLIDSADVADGLRSTELEELDGLNGPIVLASPESRIAEEVFIESQAARSDESEVLVAPFKDSDRASLQSLAAHLAAMSDEPTHG